MQRLQQLGTSQHRGCRERQAVWAEPGARLPGLYTASIRLCLCVSDERLVNRYLLPSTLERESQAAIEHAQ